MTFKIKIYDGNSALRERVNTEAPLMLMRGIVNETLQTDQMIIWAFDGPYGNARRREFYSEYKAQRKITRPDIYKGLAFIREILALTPAWVCRHEDFEGDDVIAALVKMFPNDPIQIVSTDRDLIALTDGTRITCTANPFKFPNEYIGLYKLTVGDVSDNIGGIPGYGQLSWNTADKMQLAHLLDAVIEGRPIKEGWITAANIKPGVRKWLETKGQEQLPLIMRVIAPLPVSDEQMNVALQRGINNPEAREALLERYFL